jgi:hypothetical protein
MQCHKESTDCESQPKPMRSQNPQERRLTHRMMRWRRALTVSGKSAAARSDRRRWTGCRAGAAHGPGRSARASTYNVPNEAAA